jgi:Zn-dependent oligopeptidase
MLGIYRDAFGLVFTPCQEAPTWHEDVLAFQVSEEDSGKLLGFFYLGERWREK